MDKANRDHFIQELITLAGAVAFLMISKKVMTPDFGRTLRMRTALAVKHVADAQVRNWEKVAGNAANVYNKAKV